MRDPEPWNHRPTPTIGWDRAGQYLAIIAPTHRRTSGTTREMTPPPEAIVMRQR